jgi:hypothetical protein
MENNAQELKSSIKDHITWDRDPSGQLALVSWMVVYYSNIQDRG